MHSQGLAKPGLLPARAVRARARYALNHQASFSPQPCSAWDAPMSTPAAASGINPLDQANQIKALLTQTVPDATHEYSFTPQMLQHSPTFNLWTVNNVANDFGHQIANPTLLSHYYGVLDDDHLIRYVQPTISSRSSCMHDRKYSCTGDLLCQSIFAHCRSIKF